MKFLPYISFYLFFNICTMICMLPQTLAPLLISIVEQRAEGGAAGTVLIKSTAGDGSTKTKLILDNQGNYPRVNFCLFFSHF